MPPKSSTMLPLGTPCPAFRLPDYGVNGNAGAVLRTQKDLAGGEAAVVAFICNHCPFVVHIQEQLRSIGRDFESQGVRFIAISANDVASHPDDAPSKMAWKAVEAGYTFPYCYDESQDTAKAFKAACTPDFFVFDRELKLTYRGQLDGSRPGNAQPVTGEHLRAAVASAIKNHPIAEQHPSIGCGIKWKPGNEPAYA